MAILSNSNMMVMMYILNIVFELIDHIMDMISTLENYRSANSLLNLLTIGQFLSLFAHSMISSLILFLKTFLHDTSRLSYGFLWGSALKRVVTLPIFILGFGSSILKVDLLLDIFQKRTKDRALKQEVIGVAELLHATVESIPQSILQASTLFFGDDYICINSEKSIIHLIGSFLDAMVNEKSFHSRNRTLHDHTSAIPIICILHYIP